MKKRLWVLPVAALVITALFFPVSAKLSTAVDNFATRAELIKTGITGEDIAFSDADFRQALGVTSYPDITLLSLPDPADGILKLGGLRLSVGQTVRRASVSRLMFSPASPMTTDASFSFSCGNLCGGAAIVCTIKYTDRVNAAPETAGYTNSCFSFQTRKNSSVFGTMAGYDPEGDGLCYLVLTYPSRGILTVTDAATGDFRYTPTKGYTGNDSFSYVIRDDYGNYSSPATVHIRVNRYAMDIDFDDISDGTEHAAAAYAVTMRLFGTEGDGFYAAFLPNDAVTREEFICAAMKAAGYTVTNGTDTFFDDNDSITPAARPYIAIAAAEGYVWGNKVDATGLCFSPTLSVSVKEAADILDRMIPSHLPFSCLSDTESNAPLTRADAAQLLLTVAQSP